MEEKKRGGLVLSYKTGDAIKVGDTYIIFKSHKKAVFYNPSSIKINIIKQEDIPKDLYRFSDKPTI